MNTAIYFILAGHEPVPCRDVLEWGRWLETADRQVKLDRVGRFMVSTVFLGLDLLAPLRKGAPRLFETIVFDDSGGPDGERRQYESWDDAMVGHDTILFSLMQTHAKDS